MRNPPNHDGSAADPACERLNVLQAYRRLIELSQETDALSQQCWSLAAGNAFKASSAS